MLTNLKIDDFIKLLGMNILEYLVFIIKKK